MRFTKNELKHAKDNELICELVTTHGSLLLNESWSRGTTKLLKHETDVIAEMLKRGLITDAEVELINK